MAAGVALHRPVKVVLPGPVTWSRLARDEHYGDRAALAAAVAEALAGLAREDRVAVLVATHDARLHQVATRRLWLEDGQLRR